MKTNTLKAGIIATVLMIAAAANAQTKDVTNVEYRTMDLSNGIITTTWKNKAYKIKLDDNKIIALNVDGKDIPADKWGEYSEATKDILEQVKKDRIQAQKDIQQAKKDMEQAHRDMERAALDHKQAEKDIEQAKLHVEEVMKNKIQHSKDIEQSKQDIEQARLDIQRAQKDIIQAKRDIEAARFKAKAEADKKKYPDSAIKKFKNEKD